MSKRDWAGTVFIACLIALAGLLHDQTVPLALLSASVLASAAIVGRDVLRGRGEREPSRRALRIAKLPASIRIPLRTAPGLQVSDAEGQRIAATCDPRRAAYATFPGQRPENATTIEHEPIRWEQIGDRPQPGEEEIPLELWLEDRIAAHRGLLRQRPVRGDRWLLGALHGWDVRNTHELLTKVAPDLASGYRGDPPGHLPGLETPYYERQLGWLERTLGSLREAAGAAPGADDDADGASAEDAGCRQEAERLAALYREGEQLRASMLWSTASIPGDLMRGTAVQRQVQRERLAREWDDRVLAALPGHTRTQWGAASTLPHPHPTRSLIEHTSTIAGVRDHLAAKLACLKEIIGRLDTDASRSSPASDDVREVVTAESIEGELSAFVPWAGRMLREDLTQAEVTDWAQRVGISIRARGPEGEEEMFLAEGYELGPRAELQAKVARIQDHILPKVRAGEWNPK